MGEGVDVGGREDVRSRLVSVGSVSCPSGRSMPIPKYKCVSARLDSRPLASATAPSGPISLKSAEGGYEMLGLGLGLALGLALGSRV